MSGISPSPSGAIVTKDISYLQLWPEHRPLDLLQSTFHSLILELLEHLKRTDGITDCFGCDVSILGRRRQLGMAEQYLDHPNVGIGFQQMGGKAMPQCMQSGRLGNTGHMLGRCKSSIELP